MQFECLFSEEAIKCATWAFKENNRIKSSKIMAAAFNIEKEYRKNRGISMDARVLVGGCYTFGKSIDLLRMVVTAPPPPPPPPQPRRLNT